MRKKVKEKNMSSELPKKRDRMNAIIEILKKRGSLTGTELHDAMCAHFATDKKTYLRKYLIERDVGSLIDGCEINYEISEAKMRKFTLSQKKTTLKFLILSL